MKKRETKGPQNMELIGIDGSCRCLEKDNGRLTYAQQEELEGDAYQINWFSNNEIHQKYAESQKVGFETQSLELYEDFETNRVYGRHQLENMVKAIRGGLVHMPRISVSCMSGSDGQEVRNTMFRFNVDKNRNNVTLAGVENRSRNDTMIQGRCYGE